VSEEEKWYDKLGAFILDVKDAIETFSHLISKVLEHFK
jgi:hypothetical protein